MLVKFTVENWASFRDEASILMTAGREKQHADRVPYVDTCDLKILPLAAIYGGNASGKSNLCQALGFVKNMVTKRPGPKAPIPVRPFLLSKGSVSKPVKFEIVFLASGKAYALQFAVTRNEVVDEKLEEVTASTRRLLFHRTLGRKMVFAPGVENAFLEFVERGTLSNQLFLNNAVSQNYKHFQPAYDWFDECLELITPETPLSGMMRTLQENSPSFSIMTDVLARLDTGIASLGFEKVSIDSINMPREFLASIESNLTGLGGAFWLPNATEARRPTYETIQKLRLSLILPKTKVSIPTTCQGKRRFSGGARTTPNIPGLVHFHEGQSPRGVHIVLTEKGQGKTI